MDADRALASLGRSRLFADLGAEELAAVFAAGKTLSFAAGDEVVREGEPNVTLYVVIDGGLDVFLAKTEARLSRVRLNSLGPGDCTGEYSFIDQRPTSASVVAKCATEVWTIERSELERLLDADPRLGCVVYKNLLVLLVARLRQELEEVDLFRPV